ncbi:hypothetical protein CLTEP_10710 [Clostridium tepidiprofundi DSM 19306]|uniref:TATA-box binding protein n=1 Tax=Clostridium tepidiprofundi DSM 19306 TaxID=1121338 RepID=A0A151B5H4_9CLOT|nr:hypothetical protein [Clostridium tepidiprofundi]KYH34907.1 hypothetical protein CLTEP_10710 [Clostridium tepidiprofundi DSM 19306]
MKKTRYFLLLFVIMIIFVNYSSPNASENTLRNNSSNIQQSVNFIDSVIRESNCNIVDYGIKIKFLTCDNSKIIYDALKNVLNIGKSDITSIINNNICDCLQFKNKNIQGCIECIKQNNMYKTSIEIIKHVPMSNTHIQSVSANTVKHISGEDLITLKNNVISTLNVNEKYYLDFNWYIRAKQINRDCDVECINNNICRILRQVGALNIKSLKLYNGYSTTAYTKMFRREKIDNHCIDINLAVCNYNSGIYLIIGVPEIFVSY